MRSKGRTGFLLYNAVVAGVALAGAAALLAMLRPEILRRDMLRPDRPEAARGDKAGAAIDAVSRADQTGRLAFVRPSALSAPQPGEPAPELKPTLVPTPEIGVPWSTETSAEAGPSLAPWATQLPAVPVPRETGKPAPRQRAATLKARLAEISPVASLRLAAKFQAAKAPWPPAEVALVAIKDTKQLELHARAAGGAWALVHRYPVLAASGGAGPKLRQGDRQVPEGLYRISFLNPNSAFHLSLRVNYPNAFDREMAAKDGRTDLGGDIMIHGKNLSAGCLAIGDEAVEELFVLAARTGLANVRLIIAPTDFREHGVPAAKPGSPGPVWQPTLYTEIATALGEFKAPPPKGNGLLSFFSR